MSLGWQLRQEIVAEVLAERIPFDLYAQALELATEILFAIDDAEQATATVLASVHRLHEGGP